MKLVFYFHLMTSLLSCGVIYALLGYIFDYTFGYIPHYIHAYKDKGSAQCLLHVFQANRTEIA